MDVVRVWVTGRKGWRSWREEMARVGGGATDVGVVEGMELAAWEEKWSDGEVGSISGL